jgi:hypothetical protein
MAGRRRVARARARTALLRGLLGGLLGALVGVLPVLSPAAPARAEPGPGGTAGTVAGYRLVNLGLGGDSTANDVNARGEVVGGTPAPIAYRRSAAGAVRLLPTLGGLSIATAINDRSLIAGNAMTRSGRWDVVLWSNGRIRDLGFEGSAAGLTNSGVLVGVVRPARGSPYAYRWQGGRLTSLTRYGVRAGQSTDVTGVDERGRIIGVDSAGAFLLDGTRLQRLVRPAYA